jgi:hypothetical protein
MQKREKMVCNFSISFESMASLLAKFRIECADLTIIPDIHTKPRRETTQIFDKLTQPFKVREAVPPPVEPDSRYSEFKLKF